MRTLYAELGPNMLRQLVDSFYDRVFVSEKIGPLFKNDKEGIKQKQFMFLTQFLGGPDLYAQQFGHPRMRLRHLPHKITEEARQEWLRCMMEAIETLPITNDLKRRLFSVFPKVAQHMVIS
ncbi:MAG: globin [Flavobacteriia bacterium]|jgi:hemoglobin